MILVVIFIAIIAVILLADSLLTATLIISILINAFLLLASAGYIDSSIIPVKTGSSNNVSNIDPKKESVEVAPKLATDAIFTNLYGNEWNNYDSFRMGYLDQQPALPFSYDAPELQHTVDQKCNIQARQRGMRAKQMIDGNVSKNANFYKYHFGDELDKEEAKPWWGESDF